MTVYNKKDQKTWEYIIKDAMPQGILWNSIGVKNKGIDILLNCIAEVFKNHDSDYADRFNSLKLTKDSQFLDEYWDMFGISNYIKERPESQEKKYKIVNAFAKAHSGLFTSEQLENFINDVFGLKIDIYLSNIQTSDYNNYFPCYFPFYFDDVVSTDNTVVVKLPTSNDIDDDNVLSTKGMPFRLINRDSYSDAIKMLLELLIDANLKVVYI